MIRPFFSLLPLWLLLVGLFAAGLFLSQETIAWQGRAREAAEREFRESQLAHDQLLAAEHQVAMAAVESYFLNDDQLPELIKRLETTARQAGVESELTEVMPSANKKVPGLSLAIRFDGSYASAERFLRLVELLPYLVRVESVSLELAETGEGRQANRWAGSLRLAIESYENK